MNEFDNLPSEDAEYVLNLPYHLAVGGLLDDFCQLLTEFEFINYKVISNKTQDLIKDYNLIDDFKEVFSEIDYYSLKLIVKSIQLSEKTLSRYKDQLASQLWGRIQNSNYPKIKNLLSQTKKINKPWLCPLKPTLNSPLTRLIRTLETNSDTVEFIVVTPDNKEVISARPGVPKIWDLKTGIQLYNLCTHPNPIGILVVSPNGKQIIFRAIDDTLKAWDLEKKTELFELEGDTNEVKILLITPNSKRAVGISKDNILKIWELEAGKQILTITEQYVEISTIALDDQNIVAGLWDSTIKV